MSKPAAGGSGGNKVAGGAGGSGAGAVPVSAATPGSTRWTSERWEVSTLVPTLKQGKLDVSHDHAKDPFALPLLHAQTRQNLSKYVTRKLRSELLRIPGIITDRHNPRNAALTVSFDRFELEAVCRNYGRSMGHKVVQIKLPELEKPILAIVEHVFRHTVTQEVLNISFFVFNPYEPIKLPFFPILFTGAEECVGVKRGGVLVINRDHVPVVWKGDHRIPACLTIDLANADQGRVFRNEDLIKQMPVGMRLFRPAFDYVIASVLGLKSKALRDADDSASTTVASNTPAQPSAAALEKAKKEKEKAEEEEIIKNKMAQKGAKK